MRFSPVIILSLGTAFASAASWSFDDAKLESKGVTEQFRPEKALTKPVALESTGSLKISLTATNGKKSRRPHQAFLTISDPVSGLEESYPFNVKDSGKAKLELNQNSIPLPLLAASSPLEASIVIADFGVSTPYKSKVFDLNVVLDANKPRPNLERPLRYGALPEIHHIFRPNPRSPAILVSLVFLAAVVNAIPALFVAWVALGANLGHLGKALGAAPISHALFLGSIVAMEGVFVLYYTYWNLFQVLPVAGVVAVLAFVSGSKALTEVQERRLAGLR